MDREPLYLDNAATSFPKAPGVAEAVLDFLTRIGASPGRGAYAQSREAARVLTECREHLARLIGTRESQRIVFTLNCTDALNLAIHGVVSQARALSPTNLPHIVTSDSDHNSILRVLKALAAKGVEVTRVPVKAASGIISPTDIRAAIRPATVLVAIQHASNVTGAIQPIEGIAGACRAAAVPLLVDAAQSLGHVPLHVEGIDLLAFPGHKGLLGPLGTGGLFMGPGMESRVAPLRQGGTGSESDSDEQPLTLPHRFEPGSHNMPGLAGLAAATRWILDRGADRLRAHELTLCERMLEHAASLRSVGYHILGPTDALARVAVFSLRHDEIDPHELAALLEAEHGVLTRSGLHCAPYAATKEPSRGGTTRLSFGAFNTLEDVDRAVASLRAIAEAWAAVTPR
ncbi:MAG: aminotransferase class V-fold PLP-dependent enzyme [Phycisphaeraceae bacterium]|nr:aminotransferase class V-fold PLP-dependent enzyme [Phycisphaeraceae bacterium]